jgi:hypothetical protein
MTKMGIEPAIEEAFRARWGETLRRVGYEWGEGKSPRRIPAE